MVTINIEEKILDEQLAIGKTVLIQCHTAFNGITISKTFPNDFTPEQQMIFKQLYDMLAYEGEINNRVFKCNNDGVAIMITGYQRIGSGVNDIEDLNEEDLFKLKFTRYGITDEIVEIECAYNTAFTQDQLVNLLSLGIEVSGTSSNFGVIGYNTDISIELIKNQTDSLIDMGDFKNGRIVFKK